MRIDRRERFVKVETVFLSCSSILISQQLRKVPSSAAGCPSFVTWRVLLLRKPSASRHMLKCLHKWSIALYERIHDSSMLSTINQYNTAGWTHHVAIASASTIQLSSRRDSFGSVKRAPCSRMRCSVRRPPMYGPVASVDSVGLNAASTVVPASAGAATGERGLCAN